MARKIRFEFVGDTSQLQGSLDRVQKDSDKLGGSFDNTFKKKGSGGALEMGKQFVKANPALMAMVGTSVALGAALIKATQATIEFAARADVIAKKARAIGTDAESLQVLQGALEMGGVAAETTANAIQKLSVNLGMAAKGSKMQVEALEDLNLSFEQLESVPLEEKIALIADGMVSMTSQSERAQAAQALLGRGAMDMLAAFDEGGAAIRASSEKVRAAGIISNKVAKQSEVLTDAVTIATRQWQRLKDGALEPLIPVVTMVVEKLGEMFQTLSESVALQLTAKAVAFVAEKFLGLTEEVEKFKLETEALSKVQGVSDSKLAHAMKRAERRKLQIKELSRHLDGLRMHTKRLGDMRERVTYHGKKLTKVEDELIVLRKLLKSATEDATKRTKELAQAALDAAAAETAELKATEALAKSLKKAEKEAAAAAARAVARAAARKANLDASIGQLATWSAANRDANISVMEGVAKLDAEMERAKNAEQERADAILGQAGLNKERREGLQKALTERLLSIETEYGQKRADLMVELANVERAFYSEGVQNAEEAVELKKQLDAELHEDLLANSQTQGEYMRETWERDMEDLAAVNAQIMSMHRQVFDAISAMAKVVYDEKADAYAETADRIADIDEALQGELTESARAQLEREKAGLEEQSAMEKEAALDAWRANKAVALTSAIISTALAIINALTTVPFPAGIVASVAAGVAGVAAIAAIAAEQPPQLHGGGMIPASLSGQSMTADEVIVRARQGEAVLSPLGVAAAGGESGVGALNAGAGGAGGQTVNIIRVGPRTTEAIMHDTLRISSSRLSRAFGSVRPRVGRHDARSRKA